jgi:hypothetical protein
MLTAVESSDGSKALRALVQGYLDEDIPSEQLVEDLDQIRALLPEEVEDSVLDVMDLLVGWCAPSARLTKRQES